jgi:hypothetical protein
VGPRYQPCIPQLIAEFWSKRPAIVSQRIAQLVRTLTAFPWYHLCLPELLSSTNAALLLQAVVGGPLMTRIVWHAAGGTYAANEVRYPRASFPVSHLP